MNLNIDLFTWVPETGTLVTELSDLPYQNVSDPCMPGSITVIGKNQTVEYLFSSKDMNRDREVVGARYNVVDRDRQKCNNATQLLIIND